MHCTDPVNRSRRLKSALLVAAVLLASACSQLPNTGEEVPVATDSAEALTPNPYLVTAADVPSAARTAQQQARMAYDAGDHSGASTQLQTLVQQWPQLSGAWLNLAIVQQALGDADAAQESLRSALAANDNNVFAWNALAALQRDSGAFAEAETSYRAALARWPDYADAHRNLGILLDLYLHRPEEALGHYRRAQALHQIHDPEQKPDRQLAGWIVDLERRL